MRGPSLRAVALRRHVTSTSRRVPFKPHETTKQRHQRRFDLAQRDEIRLECWCNAIGLSLQTFSAGEHWQIRNHEGSIVAEWYPRCALFRWHDGRKAHVHDIDRLRELLAPKVVTL